MSKIICTVFHVKYWGAAYTRINTLVYLAAGQQPLFFDVRHKFIKCSDVYYCAG